MTKEGEQFPSVRRVAWGIEMIALREKSHSIHSYQEFLKQTNYWGVHWQFPVLNNIYRNILHLLCLNSSVLQWHPSPLPFSGRWWMTIHLKHVSSTTQSSYFHYCMSNCGHGLLAMLLHQCCPYGQSPQKECSHGQWCLTLRKCFLVFSCISSGWKNGQEKHSLEYNQEAC